MDYMLMFYRARAPSSSSARDRVREPALLGRLDGVRAGDARVGRRQERRRLAGAGDRDDGARRRAASGRVQDGPFADTKEQLGGFFVIDVPDLDTALSWAARAPCAANGGVEVRPVPAAAAARLTTWPRARPRTRPPPVARDSYGRLDRLPRRALARHRRRRGRARRCLRRGAAPLAGRRRPRRARGLAAHRRAAPLARPLAPRPRRSGSRGDARDRLRRARRRAPSRSSRTSG